MTDNGNGNGPKEKPAKPDHPEDADQRDKVSKDKLVDEWGEESMEASDPPANY